MPPGFKNPVDLAKHELCVVGVLQDGSAEDEIESAILVRQPVGGLGDQGKAGETGLPAFFPYGFDVTSVGIVPFGH